MILVIRDTCRYLYAGFEFHCSQIPAGGPSSGCGNQETPRVGNDDNPAPGSAWGIVELR